MSKQVCDRKYVMRNVTRQRHPYLGFKAGDTSEERGHGRYN